MSWHRFVLYEVRSPFEEQQDHEQLEINSEPGTMQKVRPEDSLKRIAQRAQSPMHNNP